MANRPDPDPANSPINRSTTELETEEEIGQALASRLKQKRQADPSDPGPQEPAGRAASPYRPTVRPPVPILTVFDDGKTAGEVIRIREPRFIIGRTEGHLRFPLDGRMSARHVEVTYQLVGGVHRWVVTDLQSTHGLFVRVTRTVLADCAEFLVGSGHYRFETGQSGPAQTTDADPGNSPWGSTHDWADGTAPPRLPALTELLGREIGSRILLLKGDYWIGSDPTCQVPRPDDPFCEPRHVRLYKGTRGHWHAEHNKTKNGLWLRMPQIVVDSKIHFQLGEQQFRLKIG